MGKPGMISDHTVAASVYFSREMFKDVDARNKVCKHKILSPPSYEKCMRHIHGLPAEASTPKLHGEIARDPGCPPPPKLVGAAEDPLMLLWLYGYIWHLLELGSS